MKKMNDKMMHFLVCMAIALIVSMVMAKVSNVFAPDNPGARAATAYGAAKNISFATVQEQRPEFKVRDVAWKVYLKL